LHAHRRLHPRLLGLQPSATGAAGGKETGQSITRYIIVVDAFTPPTRS
jgi:hypothetical protein